MYHFFLEKRLVVDCSVVLSIATVHYQLLSYVQLRTVLFLASLQMSISLQFYDFKLWRLIQMSSVSMGSRATEVRQLISRDRLCTCLAHHPSVQLFLISLSPKDLHSLQQHYYRFKDVCSGEGVMSRLLSLCQARQRLSQQLFLALMQC